MVQKEKEKRKERRWEKRNVRGKKTKRKVLIYRITQIYNIPEDDNLDISNV
jgi:hypothetical protein